MKDLRKYNDILQQARTATDEAIATQAKRFVPELYAELINQGYEPYLARLKIVRDCTGLWKSETIDKWMPDEAKDESKQVGGYASAEARRAKRMIERRHKILLDHGAVTRINLASIGSVDGSVRIYTNAKFDFVTAEPGTPKSEAPEPVTVKPASSAPVKA